MNNKLWENNFDSVSTEEEKPQRSLFDNIGDAITAIGANFNDVRGSERLGDLRRELEDRTLSPEEFEAKAAEYDREYAEREAARQRYQMAQDNLVADDSFLKNVTQMGGTLEGMAAQGIGTAVGAGVGFLSPFVGGTAMGAKIGNAAGAVAGGYLDARSVALQAEEDVLNNGGTWEQAKRAYDETLKKASLTTLPETLVDIAMGNRLVGSALNSRAARKIAGSTLGRMGSSVLDPAAKIGTQAAFKSGSTLVGRGAGILADTALQGSTEALQEVTQDYIGNREVAKAMGQTDNEYSLGGFKDFALSDQGLETMKTAGIMGALFGGVGGTLSSRQYLTRGAETNTGIRAHNNTEKMINDGTLKIDKERRQDEEKIISALTGISPTELATWSDADIVAEASILEGQYMGVTGEAEDMATTRGAADVVRRLTSKEDNTIHREGDVTETSRAFLKGMGVDDKMLEGMFNSPAEKSIIEKAKRAEEQAAKQEKTGEKQQTTARLTSDTAESMRENEGKSAIENIKEEAQQNKTEITTENTPSNNLGSAAKQQEQQGKIDTSDNIEYKDSLPGNWEADPQEFEKDAMLDQQSYYNANTNKKAVIARATDGGFNVVTDLNEERGDTPHFDTLEAAENYLTGKQNDINFQESNGEQTKEGTTEDPNIVPKGGVDARGNNHSGELINSVDDLFNFMQQNPGIIGRGEFIEFVHAKHNLGVNDLNMYLDRKNEGRVYNEQTGQWGYVNAKKFHDEATGRAMIQLYRGGDIISAVHEIAHIGYENLSVQDKATFNRYAVKSMGQWIADMLDVNYDDALRQRLHNLQNDEELRKKIEDSPALRQTVIAFLNAEQNGVDINHLTADQIRAIDERWAWEFSMWYTEGYMRGVEPQNILQRIYQRGIFSLGRELNMLNRLWEHIHHKDNQDIENLYTGRRNQTEEQVAQEEEIINPFEAPPVTPQQTQQAAPVVTPVEQTVQQQAPVTPPVEQAQVPVPQEQPQVVQAQTQTKPVQEKPKNNKRQKQPKQPKEPKMTEQELNEQKWRVDTGKFLKQFEGAKPKQIEQSDADRLNGIINQIKEHPELDKSKKISERISSILKKFLDQNVQPAQQEQTQEQVQEKPQTAEQTTPVTETPSVQQPEQAPQPQEEKPKKKFKTPTNKDDAIKLLKIVENREEGWKEALDALRKVNPKKLRSVKVQDGNDLWNEQAQPQSGDDLWNTSVEKPKQKQNTQVEKTTENKPVEKPVVEQAPVETQEQNTSVKEQQGASEEVMEDLYNMSPVDEFDTEEDAINAIENDNRLNEEQKKDVIDFIKDEFEQYRKIQQKKEGLKQESEIKKEKPPTTDEIYSHLYFGNKSGKLKLNKDTKKIEYFEFQNGKMVNRGEITQDQYNELRTRYEKDFKALKGEKKSFVPDLVEGMKKDDFMYAAFKNVTGSEKEETGEGIELGKDRDVVKDKGDEYSRTNTLENQLSNIGDVENISNLEETELTKEQKEEAKQQEKELKQEDKEKKQEEKKEQSKTTKNTTNKKKDTDPLAELHKKYKNITGTPIGEKGYRFKDDEKQFITAFKQNIDKAAGNKEELLKVSKQLDGWFQNNPTERNRMVRKYLSNYLVDAGQIKVDDGVRNQESNSSSLPKEIQRDVQISKSANDTVRYMLASVRRKNLNTSDLEKEFRSGMRELGVPKHIIDKYKRPSDMIIDTSTSNQAKLYVSALYKYNKKLWEKQNIYRGLDGEWRFWIDDKDAKFNDHILNNLIDVTDSHADLFREGISLEDVGFGDEEYRLDEVLDHEELFKYYPELKRIKVYFKNPETDSDLGESTAGYFSYANNAIVINVDYLENYYIDDARERSLRIKDALMNTFLHEIQHSIQGKEGFSTGFNPESFGMIVFDEKKVDRVSQLIKDFRDQIFQENEPKKILSVHGKELSFDGYALDDESGEVYFEKYSIDGRELSDEENIIYYVFKRWSEQTGGDFSDFLSESKNIFKTIIEGKQSNIDILKHRKGIDQDYIKRQQEMIQQFKRAATVGIRRVASGFTEDSIKYEQNENDFGKYFKDGDLDDENEIKKIIVNRNKDSQSFFKYMALQDAIKNTTLPLTFYYHSLGEEEARFTGDGYGKDRTEYYIGDKKIDKERISSLLYWNNGDDPLTISLENHKDFERTLRECLKEYGNSVQDLTRVVNTGYEEDMKLDKDQIESCQQTLDDLKGDVDYLDSLLKEIDGGEKLRKETASNPVPMSDEPVYNSLLSEDGGYVYINKDDGTRFMIGSKGAKNQTFLTNETEKQFEKNFRTHMKLRGFSDKFIDDYFSNNTTGEGKEQIIDNDKLQQKSLFNKTFIDTFNEYNNMMSRKAGVKRGLDGRWRFEFSDKNSSFDKNVLSNRVLDSIPNLPKKNGNVAKMSARLEDVFDHKLLYKYYPHLKDLKISLCDGAAFRAMGLPSSTEGFSTTDEIVINTDYIKKEKTIKSRETAIRQTILHEIQHQIQDYEGLASGAGITAYERKIRINKLVKAYVNKLGGEQQAGRKILEAINDVIKNIKKVPRNQRGDLYKKIRNNSEFFNDTEQNFVLKNPRGIIEGYINNYQDVNKKYGRYFDNEVKEMCEYLSLSKSLGLNRDLLRPLEQYQKLYWTTLGEIEARQTEQRFNMSDEERLNRTDILDEGMKNLPILQDAPVVIKDTTENVIGNDDDVRYQESAKQDKSEEREEKEYNKRKERVEKAKEEGTLSDQMKDVYSVSFTKSAQEYAENRTKMEYFDNNEDYWDRTEDKSTGKVTYVRKTPYEHQQKVVTYNGVNDVKRENKKKSKPAQWMEWMKDQVIKYMFNDKHYLAKAARKLGVYDAYRRMIVTEGYALKANTALTQGIKYNGKTTRALNDIIRDVGEPKQKEFLKYCIAHRILDLKDRENPVFQKMKPDEAKKYIEEIKASPDAELFERNRKDFVEYNKALLHVLVDGGIMDEKTFQKFCDVDPNFVPLTKVMDDADMGFSSIINAHNLVNLKSPIKKIGTSMLEIANPFLEMQKRTAEYYAIASRNKAGQIFVNEIAGALEKTTGGDVIARGQGMLRRVRVDERNGQLITKPDDKQQIIYVCNNGKHEFYQVADREIYQALTFMNADQMGAIHKMLDNIAHVPSGLVRETATMVPDFGVRNVIRDGGEAFLTSEHGFLPVIDQIWGMWQVMNNTEWAQMYFNQNGEYGTLNRDRVNSEGIASVDDVIDEKLNPLKNFKEIKQAQMAILKDKQRQFSILTDIKDGNFGDAWEHARKSRGMAALKLAISPLWAIGKSNKRMNDLFELGTRVGEFKNAKMGFEGTLDRIARGIMNTNLKEAEFQKKAQSDVYAAHVAKDITLNFSQHGKLGKELNRYIPFFNASLQGIYKLCNTLETMATGTTISGGKNRRLQQELLFKAALITAMAVGVAAAGDGDEDYEEAPDYEKENFWILPNGLRFPKDQVLGKIIGNTVEKSYAQWKKGKAEPSTILKSILENFKPDRFMFAIFDLAIGGFGNYDTFKERSIVPEYMADKLGHLQKDISTSNFAVDVSEALWKCGFDISAKKIDWALQKNFSNCAKYATAIYDLGKKTFNPKEFNERIARGYDKNDSTGSMVAGLKDDIPSPINLVSGTFATNRSTFKSISDFYENYKKYKKLSSDEASMSKEDKRMWKRYEQAYKKDMTFRKQLRAIKQDRTLTGKQKREKADKIFKQQIKLAKWAEG